MTPHVRELIPAPDPHDAFLRLAHLPRAMFFDSALRHPELGRYSYVMADPFAWIESARDDEPALPRLRAELDSFHAEALIDLPPFQGGAAGVLGFELARQLEPIPRPKFDDFPFPRLACGLYDVVVAFDHAAGRAWIVSQGFPETDYDARMRRAIERAEFFARALDAPHPTNTPLNHSDRIPAAELAPQFATSHSGALASNFAPDDFLRCIERGIEYVLAGDVFQVNLAQRLLAPARCSPLELYSRLRRVNPATFGGYFDLGARQVVSASPERLACAREGRLEARPIKGTRPRRGWPEADVFSALELEASEKDRAENVMIVDLLRNDLSRVCQRDSVHVSRLCQLERYEYVQHLVSVVEGQLGPQLGATDVLAALFPGGSVTGAPKVRAAQIIAELEPTARGAYCGSAFQAGFDGALDANILIRTITADRGWWQAPVGGGITALSNPAEEVAETWHKAEGLLRAMLA